MAEERTSISHLLIWSIAGMLIALSPFIIHYIKGLTLWHRSYSSLPSLCYSKQSKQSVISSI